MARLYLSPPFMSGEEQEFTNEAFRQNWVAPLGPNVDEFEAEIKRRIGVRCALALSSGTAAMHLAMRYLGVGRGDTVFCSSMTFIGSSNSINFLGAEPVFIDSEPDSWNMSPLALRKAFKWAESMGKLPKAVIIVDLYGHPADYASLLPICDEYGVPVVEDAAEALGATYRGKPCGSIGLYNVLSFNGNKIITTSGGGMLLTDDAAAREKMLFWATQARDNSLHYEHTEYGYNYRLSNICAGIGRGQLKILDEKLKRREAIYNGYIERLKGTRFSVKRDLEWAKPNHWLTVVSVEDADIDEVEHIVTYMNGFDVEARPAWKPLHMQPLYANAPIFVHGEYESVCSILFNKGICLPSGDAMTESDIERVAELLKQA